MTVDPERIMLAPTTAPDRPRPHSSTHPSATGATRVAGPAGPTLVPLRGGLWRVTRSDGEVLGYVERYQDPQGERYRAKRVSSSLRRFISLGEFWRMDDALACFGAA
ncbi:hypothetical protein [Salinibacterium sp. GXW1014]|uniref:hypothetical protein n=1 Tax=Salinibacterium sp. GXW1014 TaxID=3377838 RepID=UPI00383AD3AF